MALGEGVRDTRFYARTGMVAQWSGQFASRGARWPVVVPAQAGTQRLSHGARWPVVVPAQAGTQRLFS